MSSIPVGEPATRPGRFANRREAGRRLAQRLTRLREQRPVVIALPRGGVPVAFEIAAALQAPLDVLAVRKLGAPNNPELGIGAVAEDGTGVIDRDTAAMLGITDTQLEEIVAREEAELRRRVRVYRGGLPPVDVKGRTVVVVDDGIATGGTDTAALRALAKQGPGRLILAVPVCAESSARQLGGEADEVVCLESPSPMHSVGYFYDDFTQVSDDEVMALLAVAGRSAAATDQEVAIPAGSAVVAGNFRLPDRASGLVLFAHGSGSSRRSPRNIDVAAGLNRRGLGTLLFDLLTEAESTNREKVFDIPLLTDRLVAATRWARSRPELSHLPIGYFGASTGAAAALCAAAELPNSIGAVVSRGGRADLADRFLDRVEAPTLLIVGSNDSEVLTLNREALERLGGPSRLALVEGAGHVFEEPGALEAVTDLAGEWFEEHLAGSR